MSENTTNINAIYNPSNNTLSLIPDGNINVPKNQTQTITLTLSCNPDVGGMAIFADTPITWGNNGAPPNYSVTPTSSRILTISGTNNSGNISSMSYPFTVNVSYMASASQDPTIINEGTGS